MDFTLRKYRELLCALLGAGYKPLTFDNFLNSLIAEKVIILRHDVDLLPMNALQMAQIEKELEVKSSYYFRAVPKSWNVDVIKKIYRLGHEVGYHYECLTTTNGDMLEAYENFRINLERLRAIVPVSTICMHGSPRSPYDSKDIWKQYSYKDLGIIGEPYLDVDFSQTFYLTDTGRCWDGYKVSVRDKIEDQQKLWESQGLMFHRTDDIIRRLNENKLPDRIMITTHPQRWNEFGLNWLKELVFQNIKNEIKRIVIKIHK